MALHRSQWEVELLSDLRVAASFPEGKLEDSAAWGESANLLGQHDAIDQCRKVSGCTWTSVVSVTA